MATMTHNPPHVVADWVPGPLYRMGLERYEELIDSGAIGKRDKVQLINGYLVATMTHNPPHAVADGLAGDALEAMFRDGWHVRASLPLRLAAQASMPEPDRVVARGARRDYRDAHPGPSDVALVVEVSDSSLAEDHKLAALYGGAGVPFYWIVNLVDRRLEVYSRPGPDGHYAALELFGPEEAAPVFADGREIGRIAVADLLP